MVKKYNLNLLVTSDDRVQAYISEIMEQVKSKRKRKRFTIIYIIYN